MVNLREIWIPWRNNSQSLRSRVETIISIRHFLIKFAIPLSHRAAISIHPSIAALRCRNCHFKDVWSLLSNRVTRGKFAVFGVRAGGKVSQATSAQLFALSNWLRERHFDSRQRTPRRRTICPVLQRLLSSRRYSPIATLTSRWLARRRRSCSGRD